MIRISRPLSMSGSADCREDHQVIDPRRQANREAVAAQVVPRSKDRRDVGPRLVWCNCAKPDRLGAGSWVRIRIDVSVSIPPLLVARRSIDQPRRVNELVAVAPGASIVMRTAGLTVMRVTLAISTRRVTVLRGMTTMSHTPAGMFITSM